MASSNHEVMVVLSDGKPLTIIRAKDDNSVSGKSDRKTTKSANGESCHRDSQPSLNVRQDRDQSKHGDEHVELRRLRSENQLLQDKLFHLEKLMAAEKHETDNYIEQMKKQLAELSEKEQCSRTRIDHLTVRIEELQNMQEAQLQDPVNVEVQVLQDELVASKLREAEAKSSFKELQQKLHHLEKQWQLFHQQKETESKAKNLSQMNSELKDQVMALKIRETSLVSELNEIRQKLMELETQNHILERQTKRKEAENTKLLDKIGGNEGIEKELNSTIKNLELKVCDLESKQKEDRVMFKIREAEFCQTAAELKRRIAELEIENQELLTSAQLHNKDQDVNEMENRILELQDEILQMKSQMSDSLIAVDLSPTNIMTDSFIGDNACLQPANFDSLVNFSDFLTQSKLLDHD